MNIFSKYLVKSCIEKKGRTVLLLISIAISGALLVTALGTGKALISTLSTQIKGNFGDFNVKISANKGMAEHLFSPVAVNDNDIKKSFKSINLGGYLSNDKEMEFSIFGTTLSDFNNYDSMEILEQNELEPFIDKKIIISKRTSENLNVSLGDELKLNILGKEESYKITAIAMNRGMFYEDKENKFAIITPEENIFNLYGLKDKYSIQFLAVDSDNIDEWVRDFNKESKENKVIASKTYDEEQIGQQAASLKLPLYFMLAIVMLMTTFIIYSSFRLIITERMPIIGTFLSQGATKTKIIGILLKESIAYGIVGGFLGALMGAGFTNLVAIVNNPLKEYGIKATTVLYPEYLIIGFVFAVILSIASTIIPILSIRKLPVKDVILNTILTPSKAPLKGFVLGIIMIVFGVILQILGEKIEYAGSLPSLFLVFIGVILIIPRFISKVFYPVFRALRNINAVAMLSFNNVRTSKVLLNNIRLIVVAVISVILILSFKNGMVKSINGAFQEMSFDVKIEDKSNNSVAISKIISENIDDKNINTVGSIETNLDGDETKGVNIYYVNPEKYKTYENYSVFSDKEKQLDDLSENDDGIILSKQISEKYNIKQGDYISISRDNIETKFKVISIFSPKMLNMGNYNLISKEAALKHFGVKYPTEYYISTTTSQVEAKEMIEEKLKGLGATISTKEEINKDTEKESKQMTDILSLFSLFTMIIGSFGVISNVSISFIQSKREISVLSSIGLTRGGRGYMIIIESFCQALIGAGIALLVAFYFNIMLTDIFKFLKMDFETSYPYESMPLIIGATVLLILVTSLSSILKSRKLNIVQGLKYE